MLGVLTLACRLRVLRRQLDGGRGRAGLQPRPRPPQRPRPPTETAERPRRSTAPGPPRPWPRPTSAASWLRTASASTPTTFLAGFGEEVELTLEVGGGFWTLSSSVDGGATAMTDRGRFELEGKKVVVRPNSGGKNTFRWTVAGDELALDLVSTTEPPYEGVPAETFQRGLYTASPFARAA